MDTCRDGMQSTNIDKRMLCLELPGKRRRGRPKTRFMDVVREDMRVVGVSDGYGEQEKLETADPLWRPLMGAVERKRRMLSLSICWILSLWCLLG